MKKLSSREIFLNMLAERINEDLENDMTLYYMVFNYPDYNFNLILN